MTPPAGRSEQVQVGFPVCAVFIVFYVAFPCFNDLLLLQGLHCTASFYSGLKGTLNVTYMRR